MSPSRPTRYHAAWILPVAAPPIRDGWVEIAGGVVTGVGRSASAPRDTAVRRVRLPSHVVLPGLVNAHTHLELSGLRGAVPRAGAMPDWARAVMAGQSRLAGADGAAAVSAAVAELRRAGTALVGDIANTRVSLEVLRRGPVAAVVFREALGFDADAAEARAIAAALGAERAANPGPHVRVAVAAHAPYSVAPGLFRALADAARGGPRSVHVAESAAELELLRTGTGAWRAVLEERSRWHSGWTPPGTGPVDYLDALGWGRSGHAARARRAPHAGRDRADRRGGRDPRGVPAQQTPGRAPARLRSAASTRPEGGWRWVPTAWRAPPI